MTDSEGLVFIEHRGLMGKGIGYLEVHLLASAVLGSAELWTRDKRLRAKAEEIGVSYRG